MSSFSSSSVFPFDVFLSFRGDDTRTTIISHLHKQLVNKGISTYKYDPEITMEYTLSEIMENSKVAVLIISKNFATSTWCMYELQFIMELEAEKKIEAIPLFYRVDPSDVTHHKGNFDLQCYQGHEKAEKVPKWREALARITHLQGIISSQNCEDEAKMVDDIVELISRKLLTIMPKDDLEQTEIARMEE